MSGPIEGLHLRQVRTLPLHRATTLHAQVWLADERLGVLERGGCGCECSYFDECGLTFHGTSIRAHLRWIELVDAHRQAHGGGPNAEQQMCEELLHAQEQEGREVEP